MIKTAKFIMRDESFECEVCGEKVSILGYTARDHCPNCLYSKHVDINPGDRASDCYGLLKPIAIETNKNKGYKIVYVCERCGIIKRNKVANDDNMDVILDIMSNVKGNKKGR